jgi:hypothetical protein
MLLGGIGCAVAWGCSTATTPIPSENESSIAAVSDVASGAETVADVQPPMAESEIQPMARKGGIAAQSVDFRDLDLRELAGIDEVTVENVGNLPESIQGLSGKQVAIQGYMKPSYLQSGISEFALVPYPDQFLFGPKGQTDRKVAVHLRTATATEFTNG